MENFVPHLLVASLTWLFRKSLYRDSVLKNEEPSMNSYTV